MLEMTGKGDLILSYHTFPYVIDTLHSLLTFHFYFIILIISLCFYLYIFTKRGMNSQLFLRTSTEIILTYVRLWAPRSHNNITSQQAKDISDRDNTC